MKLSSIILIPAIFILALSSSAFCSGDTPISRIESGFSAYTENGPKAAVEAWLKGSALEGSKEALSQANNFRQIEDFYGKFESFDIIETRELTKRIVIVCLAMNYQNGPVYMWIELFKNSKEKWVTAQFNFHTKITQVFPPEVIFGK